MQSWMIGTVAGIFAVGWMPTTTPLVFWSLAIACASLALCWRPSKATLLAFGLALGFGYGNGWGSALLADRLPAELNGRTLTLQGAVAELPQRRRFTNGGQRQRFAFRLLQPACADSGDPCLPTGTKILLSWYGDRELEVGQRWRWQVRLKRPWGLANPGSFNYQSWLAQQRFSATGSVREGGALPLPPMPGWWQPHQRLRQYLSSKLGDSHNGAEQVVRALTLGDRSAIGPTHWRRLREFGLTHLVVISGLHVGMVAAVGYFLGLFLGRIVCLFYPAGNSARMARLAAAALALCYSALSGFALPTVRALTMLACVQLLAMGYRRISLGRSLVAALLVIAVVDPLASHSPGFWLSFGAVALIAWLLLAWPHLRGLRQFLLLQLGLSLATGLAASFWFGGGSWISPLANLIAVPLVTLVIAPMCLLAAVLAPLSATAAQGLWGLAGWPLAGFFQLADLLERAGFDPWVSHQPGIVAVMLGLLAIPVLLLPRGLPLRWLALPLLLPQFLPAYPQIGRDEVEITVFDVGQGLSVLVRSARGSLLYDTGSGDTGGPNMASAVVLPYLRRHGLTELDLLVVSHGDRDHASGVQTLVDNLEIGEIWYGEQLPPLLGGRSPPQSACDAGAYHRLGAIGIAQLHPQRGAGYARSNDSSCVLLLDLAGYRVLLPGDISSDVEMSLRERWRGDLRANLLIAPHHGSLSSSSTVFIRSVAPDTVVFSAGYLNHFGHPHARVTARYGGMGIAQLATAATGALTFTVERGVLRGYSAYRQLRRYYWH